MAIRLRIINGCWVALCAVESDEKEGDIYLDDSQHYAIACKFAREHKESGADWEDTWMNELMDTQKVREAKIEIEKFIRRMVW